MAEIKPALTAEEWMVVRLRRANKPIGGKVRGYVDRDEWSDEIRHAVAAQCLYEAPFGFTRVDVGLVNDQAQLTELNTQDDVNPGATPEDRAILAYRAERLYWLADRIEALLPQKA